MNSTDSKKKNYSEASFPAKCLRPGCGFLFRAYEIWTSRGVKTDKCPVCGSRKYKLAISLSSEKIARIERDFKEAFSVLGLKY